MDKSYFVILNHPNGSIIPMVDDGENLAVFSSEGDAYSSGINNQLGFAYGFEIFKIGCGVSGG